MRTILFYLIFFSLLSCSSLETRITYKLRDDNKSYWKYLELCNQYKRDSLIAYNTYLKWYNQGIPLVRLFEFEKLSETIQKDICDSGSTNTRFNYNKLVLKPANYINDERRKVYFNKFLENYYIIPPTD